MVIGFQVHHSPLVEKQQIQKKMEEVIRVRVENWEAEKGKILKVIELFSWLMGVGVARPRWWPSISVTVLIRLMHFSLCSVIVVYGVLDFFSFGSIFRSDTYKIMYYVNKAVCYTTSYYYVFHGLINSSSWSKMIKVRFKKYSQIK